MYSVICEYPNHKHLNLHAHIYLCMAILSTYTLICVFGCTETRVSGHRDYKENRRFLVVQCVQEVCENSKASQ
jgi:hypothetical protein